MKLGKNSFEDFLTSFILCTNISADQGSGFIPPFYLSLTRDSKWFEFNMWHSFIIFFRINYSFYDDVTEHFMQAKNFNGENKNM